MQYKSELLAVLHQRGFIHQCTDEGALDRYLAGGRRRGYIGYDATADCLHVGHLMCLMLQRWMVATGHQPIILMGGGTTKIGDPSGKDETRKLLTPETIAGNIQALRTVIERFVPLAAGDDDTGALVMNNADWLDGLNYIDMLRMVGRHFTINRMLTFESVKGRLSREQPLTFLEFNYMILQAYDFLELSRRQDCRLQLGGADQWGNIVCGVELARRMDSREIFGLTVPLLVTASGAKMGKTAQGAVWLDQARLSAYDYWQFWRNTDDEDVGRFLGFFTELPMDQVARLTALKGQDLNHAKQILATEATAIAHGRQAAQAAAKSAVTTFAGGMGTDLPSWVIPKARLSEPGVSVIDALLALAFAASRSEARRLIRGGGARLDGVVITDEAAMIPPTWESSTLRVSAGKKRHGILRQE